MSGKYPVESAVLYMFAKIFMALSCSCFRMVLLNPLMPGRAGYPHVTVYVFYFSGDIGGVRIGAVLSLDESALCIVSLCVLCHYRCHHFNKSCSIPLCGGIHVLFIVVVCEIVCLLSLVVRELI